MKLEHLLLGILLIKARTGYEISRYMEMEGVFMRPRTQMSQVYRSLAQMAERGWVSFTISARPGAQDAKIYHTTAAGREAFMTWLTSDYHPTLEAVNYEFRARVFFSGFLGPESLLALISSEIEARKKQIIKYRYRDRTIDTAPDSPFDVGLVQMVEDFQHEGGTAAMDANIARLERLHELVSERVREKEVARVGARNA